MKFKTSHVTMKVDNSTITTLARYPQPQKVFDYALAGGSHLFTYDRDSLEKRQLEYSLEPITTKSFHITTQLHKHIHKNVLKYSANKTQLFL